MLTAGLCMTSMAHYIGYYSSPVGYFRIEAQDTGVQAILFSTAADVQNRQTAMAEGQDKPYAHAITCMQQLDEYFKGHRKIFDFPFSQQGTPFQQKVWSQLPGIPYGSTISYLELSRRIGNVRAIRAIGTTNGKNQLAIVVPCHRVIGANGNLVGYGGGLWRKKWLLEHELKYSKAVQTLGNW